MDSLVEWLTENGLDMYITKFEEYGWDDKSLLFKMTDGDIEMCIHKPGHKAKFREALRCEIANPSVATQTDMDMECLKKDEQRELAGRIAELLSADLNITQRKTVAKDSTGDNNTMVETVKIEPDLDTTSIGNCYTVDESDASIIGEDGMKADSDDIGAEKGALKSESNTLNEDVYGENKELFTGIETDLQQPLNSLPGEQKLCVDEPYVEGPVAVGHNEGLSPVIAICSDSENGNGCEAELLSKTSHALMKESQASYDDDLSSVCQKENVSDDVAVVISESPSPGASGGGQMVNFNNLTIIRHSDNTTIVDGSTERIDKEYDPPPNAKDNSYDKMSVLTNYYEKIDELYVETKAYRELKTIVETEHWATLLGKPGDGKSVTAMHLLLYYKRIGYQPLFISSVRQWDALVLGRLSEKQFVVIDDMFGSIYLDDTKVDEWLTMLEQMDKIVDEGKGNILVVCTSRRHIFMDVESKLYKCSRFRNTTKVDMTEKEYTLSRDEKLAILKEYIDSLHIKLEKDMVNQIKDIDTPHGFPHCVKLFCTNAFMRESGVNFFVNPEEVVQKELNNFMSNDPVKFLVLLLVLYEPNRINQRRLMEMIEHPNENVEKLFKFTGITLCTAFADMVKAVNALTNTYLTLTSNGYYTFTHDSLTENVSKVYLSLNPFHAAKIVSFQTILTHVKTPTVRENLPKHDLVVRITIELLGGNVKSVSTCALWQDQAFVDEWIRFITMPCEASCSWSCLSMTLLEKLFSVYKPADRLHRVYRYKRGFDFTYNSNDERCSLISCLLKRKYNLAVIAILNNKCIQKSLGRHKEWTGYLDSLLEKACNPPCDIDIFKAIIAAAGESSAQENRLEGSFPLIYAIKVANAECAQYIADNTNISFKDMGENLDDYFQSVKNSPLEKRTNQALIAILNSKFIQTSLGKDEEYTANLESLLQIACKTTCDIDIIKAIIAAAGESSAQEKRLNGSLALIYAIKAADSECAQYIADNTHISLIYIDIRYYLENVKNSPLEKRTNQALLAILNSEFIQTSLGRDKNWMAALESLLEITCITTCDIDVIKAIIAAAGESSAEEKGLNGSLALMNAIKAVDAECVQYIADNTHISLRAINVKVYCEKVKNSPLEERMNQALIAILNSKCIRKSLGRDKEYTANLESLLEIACITTCDIDVIKAIIAAAGEYSAQEMRLKGSFALWAQDTGADAECLKYIEDNTENDWKRMPYCGIITHVKETSSGIFFKHALRGRNDALYSTVQGFFHQLQPPADPRWAYNAK